MKKLKIAVAAFLALCAVATVGCSKNEGESQDTTTAAADTVAPLNIRYVNMDSVLKNYTLAKELVAEQQKALLDYQSLEKQKGGELQRMQNTMAQKLNTNGYLTEESLRADQEKLQKRASEVEQLLLNRQNQINALVEQQTLRVNDSIRSVMKELSELNGYDAVIDDKVTYFANPKLDVTGAVIASLNERYVPEVK